MPESISRPRSVTALVLSAALLSSLLLSACGSDDESSNGPTVAATTGIMAAISERVAGEDATVEQVIPDGASPHDFQLSAQDRQRIEESELVVENGAGLEAGIPLDEINVTRFTLAEHVGALRPFEEPGAHSAEAPAAGAEEHAGGEEEHGSEDPHVWMDPTRVAAALPALADAFAEADPEHADGYRTRARFYANQLRSLDAEIKEGLTAIPEENRELVTSHDSLGYFADRYGFEVVATPFPASGPEAEPSAATIREVEDAVRAAKVPTVFASEEDDPEVLELIARQTGVAVVTDLLVEAPGSAGSYVEMLRRDAGLIRDGLSVPIAR